MSENIQDCVCTCTYKVHGLQKDWGTLVRMPLLKGASSIYINKYIHIYIYIHLLSFHMQATVGLFRHIRQILVIPVSLTRTRYGHMIAVGSFLARGWGYRSYGINEDLF